MQKYIWIVTPNEDGKTWSYYVSASEAGMERREFQGGFRRFLKGRYCLSSEKNSVLPSVNILSLKEFDRLLIAQII